MNIVQQQHLAEIITELVELLTEKYTKGADEHGGDLIDMSVEDLLDNAIMENIDQITYLLTLKKKIKPRLNSIEEAR